MSRHQVNCFIRSFYALAINDYVLICILLFEKIETKILKKVNIAEKCLGKFDYLENV